MRERSAAQRFVAISALQHGYDFAIGKFVTKSSDIPGDPVKERSLQDRRKENKHVTVDRKQVVRLTGTLRWCRDIASYSYSQASNPAL